jgi:hypothetical protein
MKTKTKPQLKILIVFAAILCCIFSLNSFAQNPIVPTMQDFIGTWVGANQDGMPVEVKLNSNWSCEFKVNGAPVHANNPVTGYRLPQYSPRAIAENGAPAAPEILVKFYTRNAIAGVRTDAAASASNNSSTITDTSVEQVYSGIAVIAFNNNTQRNELTLYLDINNFSSGAALNTDNATPYCVLTIQ